MNNIILPVVSDCEKAAEFIKSIKRKDCTFYVGLTSENSTKIKSSKYVKVFVYKNGSKKEEMINSLSHEIGDGPIIILRKLITKEELDKFISSQTEITVCETKKLNKVSAFFYKLWTKLVRALFGFVFFEGDISVVAISENLAPVAKNISNLSYATRINRWKGISQSKVATSSPAAKKEYDVARANVMIVGWICLFLAVVASTAVYFIFCPATFLAAFLWAAALLLSTLSLLIAIIVYLLNVKTGKRIFNDALKENKNG